MFQFFSLERIKALSSRPLFSRSMRAQREVRIKKTEGRSRVKVAFFSRLKEIKIPLLNANFLSPLRWKFSTRKSLSKSILPSF
jgi:hypothetical protein